MSEHLPISTSINYDYISLLNEINKITNESHIPHYAWKDSLFIQLYNEQLVQSFKNYKFTGHNLDNELFDTYDKLMGCATSALRKRYSNSNSSYYSKSWWNLRIKYM